MKVTGFIAGSFDLIHPGYIKMFDDAKTVCSHLIVGLQTDPTLDRPEKNRLVHTLNGSGVATPRLMIALLEHYQEEDGTINLPTILHPYFLAS